METTNHDAVKLLNSLIETTLDSVNGYKEAAESVDDAQLKSMFADRSRKRSEITSTLQQEVRSFGGEPETDQSMLGKAHNTFVDVKKALTGGSTKAVVDEVERGEDFIKAKFEKAVQGDELPPAARATVTRALDSIRADHDEISALKHSMH